jgi:hypothetical protein
VKESRSFDRIEALGSARKNIGIMPQPFVDGNYK